MADVSYYDTIRLRAFSDSVECLLNSFREVCSQTSSLSFIPIASLVELGFCRSAENQADAHFDHRRIASSFTCPHGTVSFGFASSSSARLSSSRRWVVVSKAPPASAAMLSQISWTSVMRSSVDSRSIPRRYRVIAIGSLGNHRAAQSPGRALAVPTLLRAVLRMHFQRA